MLFERDSCGYCEFTIPTKPTVFRDDRFNKLFNIPSRQFCYLNVIFMMCMALKFTKLCEVQ